MLPYCCTLSFMGHSFCIQSLYCRGVKKRDNTGFSHVQKRLNAFENCSGFTAGLQQALSY